MYSYYLSIEAEEDIVRIFEYGFNHFGLKQTEKYYDELFECFNKIAFNPYMFPKYPYHNENYRYCVCGVDTIYYTIVNDQVKIITIIGKQDYW